MAVLGLLIALVAAGFTADVVVENYGKLVNGLAAEQAVSGVSLGLVFAVGAAAGLVFVLGMWMFIGGLARSRRLRKRRLELEQAVATGPVAYPGEQAPVESAGAPAGVTAGAPMADRTSGRHGA
jgi:hypothetical protein